MIAMDPAQLEQIAEQLINESDANQEELLKQLFGQVCVTARLLGWAPEIVLVPNKPLAMGNYTPEIRLRKLIDHRKS